MVTLTDNQAPTGVSGGGAVVGGGWVGGSVDGSITGSDNLGIRNVRWYADGSVVSTSADRSCDYSVTVPCSDAAGVSHPLDTTGLADGSHSVQPAVVDPAGNETRGPAFTIEVDNTAPPAPTGLTVSGGGASTSFHLSWSTPAADGGSAYAGSRWQACAGATCSSGSGGLTSATGTLPAVPGAYTVRVWLTDAAGNGGAAHAASGSVSYAAAAGGGGGGGAGAVKPAPKPADAPPAQDLPVSLPVPVAPVTPAAPETVARVSAALRPPTATLSRRTRMLRLRGSLRRDASGTVSVTVTAAGRHKHLRARIRRGHYALRTRLPRGTRRARVTVRYRGSTTTKPARRTLTVTPS